MRLPPEQEQAMIEQRALEAKLKAEREKQRADILKTGNRAQRRADASTGRAKASCVMDVNSKGRAKARKI